MAGLTGPRESLAAPEPASPRTLFGEDRPWLTVLAAATAIEFAWWAIDWILGFAPAPFLLTYLALGFGGLACALLVRATLRKRLQGNWPGIVTATVLVAMGASFFLPLKYAIPQIVPFWLDPPLAELERAVFTTDPWLILDRLFGWAAIPLDSLYGLWLPTQTLVLFLVLTSPPSPAKSRAMIAYVLIWLLLGLVAALSFSSAGPIFYDRVFGGETFAGLRDTLQNRTAWVVLAESEGMWASLESDKPGFVAGISAFPSIHVAISTWMILAARTMSPRLAPYAVIYTAVIWIASVQLGWHYVVDGLAGMLGVLALWAMSNRIEHVLR